jgi:hypothetical protein
LLSENNLQYGKGDNELFPKVPPEFPTNVPKLQELPVSEVSEYHVVFVLDLHAVRMCSYSTLVGGLLTEINFHHIMN